MMKASSLSESASNSASARLICMPPEWPKRVDHRFLVDLQLNAVRVRNQLLRNNSRAELREHVPYHKEVRSGPCALAAGEARIDPAGTPESQCGKVFGIFRNYANRSSEAARQVRDDLAEDLGAVSVRGQCHVSVKRGPVVGCGPDADGHLRGVDVAHGKPEVRASPPRSSES